ncbi:MAG TPA: MarR family transcriptional regulator [Candidatus Hydrogenedentes bacterium]|nr:MarR family transcriptional regulator [Candidatus Hydrogenedentota bacterium]
MSLNKELELEQPLQDVRHELTLNIVRTATLMAIEGERLFRRYGLTEAQFNALFALKYKTRPWSQSDLGKRLVVTRASVTSLMDKLEAKGLVRRMPVPGNRRAYHVELTPRGKSLVDKVEPIYRANIHHVTRFFSESRCRDLIAAMEKLRAEIRALRDGQNRPETMDPNTRSATAADPPVT